MAEMFAITLRCRDDAIDTFRQVLAEVAEPSREEAGNCCFAVAQSAEEPSVFLVVEAYTDSEAYQAHLRTDWFKRVERELFPLLEDRQVSVYRTLGD